MKPTQAQIDEMLKLLEEQAVLARSWEKYSSTRLPAHAAIHATTLKKTISPEISGSDWRKALPSDKVLVIPMGKDTIETLEGESFEISDVAFDADGWPKVWPMSHSFVWRPLFEKESLSALLAEEQSLLEEEWVRDYLFWYMRKGFIRYAKGDPIGKVEDACEKVACLFTDEEWAQILLGEGKAYALRFASPANEVRVLLHPGMPFFKRDTVLAHVALDHHLTLGHPLEQMEVVALSYKWGEDGPERVEERSPALCVQKLDTYRLFGTRREAEGLLWKCLKLYAKTAELVTDNCGEKFARIQYHNGTLHVFLNTNLEGYFYVSSSWDGSRDNPEAFGVLREIGATYA